MCHCCVINLDSCEITVAEAVTGPGSLAKENSAPWGIAVELILGPSVLDTWHGFGSFPFRLEPKHLLRLFFGGALYTFEAIQTPTAVSSVTAQQSLRSSLLTSCQICFTGARPFVCDSSVLWYIWPMWYFCICDRRCKFGLKEGPTEPKSILLACQFTPTLWLFPSRWLNKCHFYDYIQTDICLFSSSSFAAAISSRTTT